MLIFTKDRCICITGDQRYCSDGQCLACLGSGVKDLGRERALKHNLAARVPSQEEYLAFDGAHCRDIYASLADDWQCPACSRTKFQILRWSTLFPKIPEARRPGWAGGYHRHHDHARDEYRVTRFPSTVICEQCNSADGTVKRKLKLPSRFSFAPWEIRCFVRPWPHGKHLLDYRTAEAIYKTLFPGR